MRFDEISRDLAKEFLQTIVVVDDQADFTHNEPKSVPGAALLDPEEITFVAAAAGPLEAVSTETVAAPPTDLLEEKQAHSLDAKTVVDGFAEEGIVCSIIRPSEHELAGLKERVRRVAGRADIVVLDWVLHGDESGERTLEIIDDLAQAPKEHRRSRLIAVYSGQRKPSDITDQIEKRLHSPAPAEPLIRIDQYTISRGPVRIAVFSKRYVPSVDPTSASRKVSEPELPARLIQEFAQMTNGIVPNVVIDAIAHIRRNTHRLLSTFHRGLDAPLLNHRAMLPQPDDTKAFIRWLVAGEIGSLLDEYDVGRRTVDLPALKAWLEREASVRSANGEITEKVFSVEIAGDPLAVDAEQLGYILEHGISTWDCGGISKTKKEKFMKRAHEAFTAAFARPGENPSELDSEFAALSALRTRYRDDETPPMLSLGTILRKREEQLAGADPVMMRHTYWLCVQAPCDSVRVKVPRKFPLLPLEIVTDNSASFNLVLRDHTGCYIRVRIGKEPYEMDLVFFNPSAPEVVQAERVDEQYEFRSSDGVPYQWVAELRFEYSQRATNEHATRTARIGLDEYEWLRRSA